MGQDDVRDAWSSGKLGGADQAAEKPARGIFPQTRWTLVQRMQDRAATHVAVNALNELCQIYWHPVYVYVR